MFNRARLANPDVSNWDTSQVIDMFNDMFDYAMFEGATSDTRCQQLGHQPSHRYGRYVLRLHLPIPM